MTIKCQFAFLVSVLLRDTVPFFSAHLPPLTIYVPRATYTIPPYPLIPLSIPLLQELSNLNLLNPQARNSGFDLGEMLTNFFRGGGEAAAGERGAGGSSSGVRSVARTERRARAH